MGCKASFHCVKAASQCLVTVDTVDCGLTESSCSCTVTVTVCAGRAQTDMQYNISRHHYGDTTTVRAEAQKAEGEGLVSASP